MKTEQAAGFQSFRMRTFKAMNHRPRKRNTNLFRALNPRNLTVKRLRSKALSPVRLSRLSEFQPLSPITTQSPWERRKLRGGFTLIEVVVALAILGIGLTAIIELFSGGLRLARTSAEFTKAVSYARMKMEEVSLKPALEVGTEEGEFDGTYSWQIDVKKVDILPAERETEFKPPVDFLQVKITVRWKSGSQTRATSVESYKTVKPEEQEKKEKTASLEVRIPG